MDQQQIKEWIKKAEHVGTTDIYMDGCTNSYETKIYAVQGDPQLYALQFQNGTVSEKMGEHGYVRGVYEPYPVVRRKVVRSDYEYDEAVGESKDIEIEVAGETVVTCSDCGRKVRISMMDGAGHDQHKLSCCPFCFDTAIS